MMHRNHRGTLVFQLHGRFKEIHSPGWRLIWTTGSFDLSISLP
jgi:hypothetical protein